jgi:O-antigen ligase
VRASIVLAGTLVVFVLAGTNALGATYHAGGNGPLVRALTERRVVLWHESLSIIAAHPGGVGPGRFADVDPTAIRDPDASWAHNEFLQQGVELGWAGLALLVLVFAWGFARLWVQPAPDMVVALGAASFAALGVHACVDYVLHVPAVPLTAAALLGTAQAVPFRRSRRDGDEPRQEGFEGGGHPDGVAGAATVR